MACSSSARGHSQFQTSPWYQQTRPTQQVLACPTALDRGHSHSPLSRPYQPIHRLYPFPIVPPVLTPETRQCPSFRHLRLSHPASAMGHLRYRDFSLRPLAMKTSTARRQCSLAIDSHQLPLPPMPLLLHSQRCPYYNRRRQAIPPLSQKPRRMA